MKLREFVETLDNDTMKEIVRNYEEFEQSGTIGDKPIRKIANEYMERIGARKYDIILWMDSLVKEIYRVFAYRYLERCNQGNNSEEHF